MSKKNISGVSKKCIGRLSYHAHIRYGLDTVYRVGSASVRQLTLTLRNSRYIFDGLAIPVSLLAPHGEYF